MSALNRNAIATSIVPLGWLLCLAAAPACAQPAPKTGPACAAYRYAPPSAAALEQIRSWSSADKLVGTTYFYWYRWPDRHFFDDAAHTDDALTDHFPNPESVSMLSKAWHKKQMLDVMDAGIDMVWPVYWAAPGNFDDPEFSLYVKGLAPLQEALDEIRAAGRTPPKVGLFYDTSSLLKSVRFGSGHKGGTDLTTPEGREVFYGTIRSFFCNVHPRHWACIDGRPIVLLYASGFAEKYDQKAFDYVYRRFAEEFGGIRPYIVREVSWKVKTDSSYQWGSSLAGPLIRGIAAVGPGYDDRAVPERFTPVRYREDGNFYRYSWLKVLGSSARIVHVETWDEMHEGTDICESVEYGRKYIDLTRHYVEHFKAGTVPDEHVTLKHPDPVSRPPDMKTGKEYAGAEAVSLKVDGRRLVTAGIYPVKQGDGRYAVLEHAGRWYIASDPDFDTRYIYFTLADPFWFDSRGPVELTIEYLDEGAGTFQLQYDSHNRKAPLSGAYANSDTVSRGDTGTLKKHTFRLPDARFANRENGGSDFRFFVNRGRLYIRSIELRKVRPRR